MQKILIANRGEIAVRIMRTCRQLGIATVAVYSEADTNALHVRTADESFALGGITAAESYLNTEKILEVLATSGADAVHPGYGFYSENAAFARAVSEQGITWIGPPPEAMEAMGDKISARQTAARASVASVPGTTEPVDGPQDVITFGEQHGFPVAIKAAYGGGGRGMKIVESANEAEAALASAQREAEAYFGRSEAYLEKYLTHPRHIEMQVLADTHGNIVWLGERDCSVQRRHQKLIEESPATGLSESSRETMGEAAVSVARACGYVNAGTIEFLYQDGEFFFLEMNTRLQVEHCVTEAVTGLDLVEEQIKIARGEQLGIKQEDVSSNGHAIECRINAEDPSANFIPSPGKITELSIPENVRWDGGYEAGDEVPQHYDNLIGKLVVWAPDRAAALQGMAQALSETLITGVATTIPALRAIIAAETFMQAEHSTRWLENAIADGGLRFDQDPDDIRNLTIHIGEKTFDVKVRVLNDGRKRRAKTHASIENSQGDGSLRAPMQGTVVQLLVEVGATVAAGESVIVLEAMKMENHLAAPTSGIVQEIRIEAGTSVGMGDVLLVIAGH